MVAEEIIKLREEIPEGISLVAVSKFHPASMIREAYDVGQRLFGESRVQELLEKIPLLPEDIEWHFIGHLQTNKVRQLIGKVALIESVDSEKLLALIDSESRKAGVVTNVLMQVHVAAEETKFGFLPEELMSYFKDKRFENLTNTHICGVMGMASNTSDMSRVRADFAEIRRIFREISEDNSLGLRGFDRVSMGMSHDWRIAVEEGSTSVRIGSLIFGEREY
ncbi:MULTISPECIES: YggS family pyridoxal phosphate-dependent enzyme [Bacteroidales]|jgi:pyridoxal phosphate enzyme (YggS family)|uniref:YggS family pyridoxal phosphate-dependent enzyme n=1 Tax=Bacteroidales TaxID=171549 RepID=UPI00195D18F1|nr:MULTISPECIES: YggS family pyridoxal phosphate-dependent enzyme [Bacteroidales]MBJ2198547.1 YggS family pyridoxal phosphate-dependent enzyme [Muribaculaceae bacterium]MCI9030293.1 YggS family pyridoxal phosphate-dependent enzyme [Muribaculaceae bacterium]